MEEAMFTQQTNAHKHGSLLEWVGGGMKTGGKTAHVTVNLSLAFDNGNIEQQQLSSC